MRVPADIVKRAMAKRKRATDEAEGSGRKTRPRFRSPDPPPSEPQPNQWAPPIDLTAESPLEALRAEVVPPPVESVPGVGPSKGEEAGEECPPTVGPSAEEMLLASGETQAASASTEPAEGSGVRAIPSKPSLMNHGRLAERLLAPAYLPKFQEELRCQGCSAFFRDASVALLWLVNSMPAAREVTLRANRTLSRVQQEANAAWARAERAKGALEVDWAEQAEELEEARRRAVAELERTQIAEKKVDVAKATISARDLRIDSLHLEMKAAE